MIKNNFVIKHAGKTIRRHNSIGNVFGFYKLHQKLCAFLYIKCDGNEYFFKQPTLSGCNFDPQKGRLFVTYEAGLNASELGGRTIESVGFSASSSPLDIVNSSTAGIVKKQGEPMHISGTLQLSLSQSAGGGQARLLGGDNRLAKMLLGAEDFNPSLFRATFDTENTPMDAYVYADKYQSQYCAPAITTEQISFSCSFPVAATGAVILCDGVPVLRFMPKLATSQVSEQYLATQNDSLTFDAGDKVVSVENVVINSATDAIYTLTRVPSSLTFVRTSDFTLPKLAQIRTDCNRRHFAMVSGDRVALLSLEGGEATITKWFLASDVVMCEDGAAFLIGAGGLGSGGSGSGGVRICRHGVVTDLGFTAGEKYAAVATDGKYIFATYRAGKVWYYSIDKNLGVVEQSYDSAAAADNVHIFSADGMVCAVCDTRPAIARSVDDEDTLHQYWLNNICNASWFSAGNQIWFDKGRLIVYEGYFDRTYYYYQMSMKSVVCPSYGRIFGEFAVRNKGISADILCAYSVGTKYGTTDCAVTFAATVDSFLYLFLTDGRVQCYYIGSKKMRIDSGRITAGFVTGFTLKSVVPASQMSIKLGRG